MRRTDAIFLCCVVGCAGLFAVRSVKLSVPLLSGESATNGAAFGAAGQSRDIDLVKLRRLLERRALSDHEAEFYEPADQLPPPVDHEKESTEPAVLPAHQRRPSTARPRGH